MINDLYATTLTLLNKNSLGNITPERFNELANDVQLEIFREYFENANRDGIRERKNLTTKGYGNLGFNERQRIAQLAVTTTVSISGGLYALPANTYFIEEDGVTDSSGRVVDATESSKIGYMSNSLGAPSTYFPVYEKIGDSLKVYPATVVGDVTVRYVREPLAPKWTYIEVANNELFDPTNNSYQDFELHKSEFSNILMRILSRCGLVLREKDVITVAENTLQKNNIKENN